MGIGLFLFSQFLENIRLEEAACFSLATRGGHIMGISSLRLGLLGLLLLYARLENRFGRLCVWAKAWVKGLLKLSFFKTIVVSTCWLLKQIVGWSFGELSGRWLQPCRRFLN